MYSENNKGIKSWAEDDRPREKLILKGKAALSDAELIAILIGSGSRNETAVDLAKRILASVQNNLNELGRLSVNDLTQFKGIGEAKAISIITALELGKRRRHEEAVERKKVESSQHVFDVMQPIIGDLPHEEFWVLFLNNHNKIMVKSCISKGAINGTLADVRIILREAIGHQATAIILAHNHPSGNQKPSLADQKITKKIKEAGTIMDISVLDHIIVCEQSFFSFADEGLL